MTERDFELYMMKYLCGDNEETEVVQSSNPIKKNDQNLKSENDYAIRYHDTGTDYKQPSSSYGQQEKPYVNQVKYTTTTS